ncbi:MAG: hypothetical protein ACK5MZ_08115 [Aestuariibaculum sp.]
MAKQIKAIKCPQCGSINKELVKDDHYICSNCSTEYFLDNDYTHIIHHHKHSGNINTNTPKYPKGAIIAIISMAVFFLITVLVNLFSTNTGSINIPVMERFNYSNNFVFKNTDGELIAGVLGLTKENELKTLFYNTKGDLVKEEKIEKVYLKSDRVSIFNSTAMDIFAVVNEIDMYRFNKQNLSFELLTPELEKTPELASGIAGVNSYISDDYVTILNRNGQEFCYYPSPKIILSKSENYGYFKRNVPEDIAEHDFFTFNDGETSDVYKLIKYTLISALGKTNKPINSWFDYMFEKDKTPQYKQLKALQNKSKNIVKIESFTPDRIFFVPQVLYNDNDILIIFYAINKGDNRHILQALNPNTAEVFWTTDMNTLENNGVQYVKDAMVNKNEVILASARKEFFVLNRDNGELKQRIVKYY